MNHPLDSFNKNERTAFWLVVAFFGLFLLLRILSGIRLLGDSQEYLNIAKRIRDFSYFSNIFDFTTSKRPIIYPLFLSFFTKLPNIVPVIFQTFLGIYTFYILIKILKKYQIEIKSQYIWFLILTPSIFIYTNLIMAEVFVFFLVTLLYWILLQEWSKKNFFYIQMITLLLAFTKPVFYPIIYFNLIFWAVYLIKKKTFSIWLLIPVIVLQLFISNNEKKSGYRYFSSIENFNLVTYNLYLFKAKTDSESEADKWLKSVYDSSYQKMDFKERNIHMKKAAVKEIKEHFFQYSTYHFLTAIRGIFDPGRFDIMTFFKDGAGKGFLELLNKDESLLIILKNKFVYVYIVLIPIFLLNIVKWFYSFKYLLAKKLDMKIYYFVAVFAIYILLSGPVNCSRYIMPFQGILILFTVLGLTHKKSTN